MLKANVNKVAFITGITGQDGSYLAEFLCMKANYQKIYGLVRRCSVETTHRLKSLLLNPTSSFLELRFGDMTDISSVRSILHEIEDFIRSKSNTPYAITRFEIYNLAAQSDVAVSFKCAHYTTEVNFLGTVNLLEAIKSLNIDNQLIRFYQAGTSEQFGNTNMVPQDEKTPFQPVSPYAVSKTAAYWTVRNYRRAFGMFCVTGLLFNHESPRRGVQFVTRKITRFMHRVYLCHQHTEESKQNHEILTLGNLDSLRDWGHSKDYVEAMWLMLQADNPQDYVIATGRQMTVRDFVEKCFAVFGISLVWVDRHLATEKAYDTKLPENERTEFNCLVNVDFNLLRPLEVENLQGDASKAQNELGWHAKINIDAMIREMILADD